MSILKKVSSLSEEQLRSICNSLSQDKKLSDIFFNAAGKAAVLFENPKFKMLRDLQTQSPNAEFSSEDFQKIIELLQKLAFIGQTNSSGEYSDYGYIISAEGLAITNEFYRHKAANEKCYHQVQVVKNIDKKRISANKFIHSGFLKALQDDLKDVSIEMPFEKTYVIEREGGIGGNHVITVSVRKNAGEEAPLIDMFDSSPSLVRIGLRQCQENIASGKLSHFIVLATLQKAFDGKGLKVAQDKFFHNAEPFQSVGFVYCGTFALEQAYINARMSRVQHEDFLRRNFIYDSVLGGKTEMDVGPEEIERSLIEARSIGSVKPKNYQSPIAAQSHFNSHYEDHEEPMKQTVHHRKNDPEESMHDRRRRYLETNIKGVAVNNLVQQKSMRHRIHLFEILRYAALNMAIFHDVAKEKSKESAEYILELEKRNSQKLSSESVLEPNKEIFDMINETFGGVDNILYNEQEDAFEVSLCCGKIRFNEILQKVKEWNEKGGQIIVVSEEKLYNKENGFDFGDVEIDENFKVGQEIKLVISKARDLILAGEIAQEMMGDAVSGATASILEEIRGVEK